MRLLVVEYHVHNDRWSSAETEALYNYYKADGTPSVYFDGGNGVAGGEFDYLYARYKKIIEKELTEPPLVLIAAARHSDTVSGPVRVRLSNVSGQVINEAQLFGVAYQDHENERHYFQVTDFVTVHVSTLAQGETLELELNFENQASLLNVVVFLKSSSGKILQAVLLPGSDNLWLP